MPAAEQPSFESVYDDHVWHVYGFVAYRVNSREEAEDLTQQTFERALRAWRKFDPRRASALTWLIAIARNLVIDHFRRGGGVRTEPLDGQPDTSALLPTVAGPESDLGLDPALEQAMNRLGDRDRELIALRFGGDLTGPEIAEMTGLSVANVHQILSRALRQLRGELAPEPASGGERPDAGDPGEDDPEQPQARSPARSR